MGTDYFYAIPLTPIHIGDGGRLRLEQFLIEEGELLRFNPSQVIADMSAQRQQEFIELVGRGRLKDAQALIHDGVDRKWHVFERIAIGAGSEMYLRNAVNDPMRKGEASPFIRSAGLPFVPGSSLKGAFRTALVDRFAHDDRHQAALRAKLAPEISRLKDRPVKTGPYSDKLQEIVLDCPRSATERDPLRYLAVGDGVLPDHSTRFDKVTVGWSSKKADDPNAERQLHVERLWSFADGNDRFAAFRLAISVTDLSQQVKARSLDRDGKRTPSETLTIEAILNAADSFHRNRLEAELRPRFFAAHRNRLEALLTELEGRLHNLVGEERPVLLRVGRFGHFESKSVDGYRRGWQALPRPGRFVEEGSSRAIMRDAAGFAWPFGWLMLVRETAEVVAWAQQRAPRPLAVSALPSDRQRQQPSGARSAPRPAQPKQPAPSRRAFVGDEEVKVGARDKDRVFVEFLRDGEIDTDWVDASKIRYE